jgi:hypothetical protein
MKLINLNKVNEFLECNDYAYMELFAYTKCTKLKSDLSEIYQLQSIDYLKEICSKIIKDIKDLHHIEIVLKEEEDQDFDQVIIYKH